MKNTTKKYFTSTMFSGETILSKESYNTFEEAKANTDKECRDAFRKELMR